MNDPAENSHHYIIPDEEVRRANRELHHAISEFEKAQEENINRLMIATWGKRCDYWVSVLDKLQREGRF